MKTPTLKPGTKVHYSPLEVAIRWSDLLEQEGSILDKRKNTYPTTLDIIEQWPLLHLNIERLFDAMRHNELLYGRAGITVCDPEMLSSPELTLRHVDLRRWMSTYYPTHKPGFLFDEEEWQPNLTLEQADVRALLQQLQELKTEVTTSSKAPADKNTLRLSRRGEIAYLNIIGALLTLMLGQSPSGTRYSVFNTLESVISALIAHHDGRPGITERILWAKFSEAKRQLCTQS
ncbi:hypothetical protein [Pseudomonas koreensis]|uniref:Receptor protein-tyrosine kinase n=1 Tax=Pseudomonas koreensis TaxID=198620 RepID=A0A9X2XES1_9PSED|nr:hypothetical protein [Pseudomonas koreensis]MCU7247268.1 hypothetical protein [Pseudomonas koreensis]